VTSLSGRAGTSVLALALALVAAAETAAAAPRTITLRTDDGVNIAASLYEASRHPAPAVVLLHMLTRSRDDWQGFGNRLADAGISALAIDLRGHGSSGSGTVGADGEIDLSRMMLDVTAASAYLTGRTDLVKPGAIGILGASVGASLAILEAAADPAIRSLALLSPGVEYRTLRVDEAMKKYGERPALLVAASNDPYALRSVKRLAAIGGGIRETRTLEGTGHGTVMLAREADLGRLLVDWFLRTLV